MQIYVMEIKKRIKKEDNITKTIKIKIKKYLKQKISILNFQHNVQIVQIYTKLFFFEHCFLQ